MTMGLGDIQRLLFNFIQFQGSTSGSTKLQATAAAGSSTVVSLPGATTTLVGQDTTDTLTNKTLTSPVITGATQSGTISADTHRTSAAVTANGTATYANVTGLSQTVVAGTYAFEIFLPSTVASGTGGIKYAFNYTTAALSALEATGFGYTASAVAVQHTTTTTTQADLFSQAAVVIATVIKGTMVVTTGGTVDLQMAQNTSNGSNTVALIGGYMRFVRTA